MNIPSGLLALVVLLMVAAYIAQPLFATRQNEKQGRADQRRVKILRQKADLLAERNRIYDAIHELDFDHATNKVSEEDYALQRYHLVAQGVDILQQIDALPALDEIPESDPFEAAVLAWRTGSGEPLPTAVPEQEAAGFCPNCGQPAAPGDRFCGACGTRL